MSGKLIEVKLRRQGKIAFFDNNGLEIKTHDIIIVESERGLDYGQIISDGTQTSKNKPEGVIRRVVRKATAQDLAQVGKNKQDISNVFDTTARKIEERKLSMKLVEAEYSFDRSKIIFYFTAEGRVDFRELVRDLASLFKARIELKQIGVRDEVKMFDGFGCCGRRLCCSSFLKDFEPVTIRMAKQQNMPLNPEKISGCCGRLMCCLGYEYQTYKEYSKSLPKEGQYVETGEGKGRVISVQTLKQKYVVELEDERKIEICLKENRKEQKEDEKRR
ncbi:MAG: stage 0 sporulation family protein [Candidatus Omnitrophota bacterium]